MAASAPPDQATAASAPGRQAQLDEVVPKIMDIMKTCDEESGGWHAACMKIAEICFTAKLAEKERAMAQVCGIHPNARMGHGLNAFDANAVLMDVFMQGYDERNMFENPSMGFEKAEDDNIRAWQKDLIQRNWEEGNEYLHMPALVGANNIAAVNIIEGECMRLDPEITDEASRIK